MPHNARESHPVSNLHSDLSFHSWFINGYNYLQNHSGKGFFQRFCKALAKGSLAVCIFFHLRKCAQDLRCILFSWELLKWCIRKVSELLGWNIRTAEPEPLFGFTQNLNPNDGRSQIKQNLWKIDFPFQSSYPFISNNITLTFYWYFIWKLHCNKTFWNVCWELKIILWMIYDSLEYIEMVVENWKINFTSHISFSQLLQTQYFAFVRLPNVSNIFFISFWFIFTYICISNNIFVMNYWFNFFYAWRFLYLYPPQKTKGH